jgi:hypothetical protein
MRIVLLLAEALLEAELVAGLDEPDEQAARARAVRALAITKGVLVM